MGFHQVFPGASMHTMAQMAASPLSLINMDEMQILVPIPEVGGRFGVLFNHHGWIMTIETQCKSFNTHFGIGDGGIFV